MAMLKEFHCINKKIQGNVLNMPEEYQESYYKLQTLWKGYAILTVIS